MRVQGATGLRGIGDIRTSHSRRRRPLGGTANSPYLAIYLLIEEKKRLEKELDILEKRKKSLQGRGKEVEREIKKLELVMEKVQNKNQSNVTDIDEPQFPKVEPKIFKQSPPMKKNWKFISLEN